jgi:predicted nucleic acid-binding protein
MDVFIAATALEEDVTLVTGNVKHFERIPGLKIENWIDL